MARVLLFGRLRDVAGWREKVLDPAPPSLSALIARLTADDPDLGAALKGPGVRAAIDKVMVSGDRVLTGREEVAFLPPMSGG